MEWSLFSFLTSRSSPMEWSLISLCLHQGPLRWNGHWFSYVYSKTLSDGMVIVFFPYIKALSDGMVIDFLCLHQDPLRWNGHWFSYVYIKTLSDGMVIDFLMFTARPSLMEWSLFSFFTSRPSPMEWLLISLYLRQSPLQGNNHWFLCYIRTLSYGMVESFFTFHIMTLFTELVIAPIWVGFYSSSSSLKFRQNWCLYLYLSFTTIIWKCHIFILSNKI